MLEQIWLADMTLNISYMKEKDLHKKDKACISPLFLFALCFQANDLLFFLEDTLIILKVFFGGQNMERKVVMVNRHNLVLCAPDFYYNKTGG